MALVRIFGMQAPSAGSAGLSSGGRRGAARRDHLGGAGGRGCLALTRHPRPPVIELMERGTSPSAAVSDVLAARIVALGGAALDGQSAIGSRGLRRGF